MGVRGSSKAALQMFPVILYVVYADTLLFVGGYALFEDRSVVKQACGKQFHIWKFALMNWALWLFATVSYCVWRGGGEGARARAMVLCVFHFGFFMWGLLMWQNMTTPCSTLFDTQYKLLWGFHHVCTITNGVFFALFFFHETWLGKATSTDYTIMAEIQHRYNTPYRPPMDILPPPGPMGAASMPSISPPPPAGLPPQLSYEYEKIMQSTSSSSLPQTTP